MHGRRVILFVAPGSGEVAYVAGNRARRILKAALREVAPGGVVNHDVVLVAREDIRGARSMDLIEEMGELLERAGARP